MINRSGGIPPEYQGDVSKTSGIPKKEEKIESEKIGKIKKISKESLSEKETTTSDLKEKEITKQSSIKSKKEKEAFKPLIKSQESIESEENIVIEITPSSPEIESKESFEIMSEESEEKSKYHALVEPKDSSEIKSEEEFSSPYVSLAGDEPAGESIIRDLKPGEKIPKDSLAFTSKELRDSWDFSDAEYLKRKRKSSKNLRETGLSVSGTRAILHDPKKDVYYVQKEDVLGKGQYKEVFEASKVKKVKTEGGKSWQVSESEHVLARPRKDVDKSVIQAEFQHEKIVAEYLKKKIDPKVLSEHVAVLSTVKVTQDQGVFAAKKTGRNLDSYIPLLTVKEKLALGSQMALSLDLLHEAGIVHRDIKPDNFVILLDKKGNKKLDERGCIKFGITDFGTCFIRETGKGKEVKSFPLEFMDPRGSNLKEIEQFKENIPTDMDNYMLGLSLVNVFSGESMDTFKTYIWNEARLRSAKNTNEFHAKLYDWKTNYQDWKVWEKIDKKLSKDGVNPELKEEIITALKFLVDPNNTQDINLKDVANTFNFLYKKYTANQ